MTICVTKSHIIVEYISFGAIISIVKEFKLMVDTKFKPGFIPGRLKTRRKEKKLTQKTIAALLDVSQSRYSEYENGVHVPRDDVKVKLAQILDAPVSYLFFDSADDKMSHFDDGR